MSSSSTMNRRRSSNRRSVPLLVNVGLIIGDKEHRGLIEDVGKEKDEVRLIGYGLNARVDGWLDVHEQPAMPTTGNGEIRSAGTTRLTGRTSPSSRDACCSRASPFRIRR